MLAVLFFSFVMFVYGIIGHPVNAQEVLAQTEEAVPQFVQYDLAFPGILPDQPLYKLKVLRDKLQALLIANPKKKIDFYLRQTDKGILASAMLVDKNNIPLAQQTALKAEHNYTLLTYELYKLAERPNPEYFKTLQTAALKHQEVIRLLISRVSENQRVPFEQVLEFSTRNLETVKKHEETLMRRIIEEEEWEEESASPTPEE